VQVHVPLVPADRPAVNSAKTVHPTQGKKELAATGPDQQSYAEMLPRIGVLLTILERRIGAPNIAPKP